MGIDLGLLKYFGVDPVLPAHDFPGAADSDGFNGSWEVKSSSTARARSAEGAAPPSGASQQRVDPSSIVAALTDAPASTPAAEPTPIVATETETETTAKPTEETVPASTVEQAAPITTEQRTEQTATAEPSAQPTAQTETTSPTDIAAPNAVDSDNARSSDSTSESGAPSQAMSLHLHVLQHAPLNILVLADMPNGERIPAEVAFLKKILKSFSRGDTQSWHYDKFSWPPSSQRLAALSLNAQAGRDAFQGYLESNAVNAPKVCLCFDDGAVSESLNIDRNSADGSYAQYNMTWFPSLSTLMNDPAEKEALWEFVQAELLG
ncbi:MAG: hypothetical protein AAGF06_05455 [Pseudomonadota bacterium]